MEDNFIIECRYEHWTKNGKEFCSWYVFDSTGYTEKEAKQKIEEQKKEFDYIDVKTKLKHEYRLTPYCEYLERLQQINKEVASLKKKQEKYYQSKEYKELLKKKRIAAKERKEKQKLYEEMKNGQDSKS